MGCSNILPGAVFAYEVPDPSRFVSRNASTSPFFLRGLIVIKSQASTCLSRIVATELLLLTDAFSEEVLHKMPHRVGSLSTDYRQRGPRRNALFAGYSSGKQHVNGFVEQLRPHCWYPMRCCC